MVYKPVSGKPGAWGVIHPFEALKKPIGISRCWGSTGTHKTPPSSGASLAVKLSAVAQGRAPPKGQTASCPYLPDTEHGW